MNQKIVTIKDFSKGCETDVNKGSFYFSQNIKFNGNHPYIMSEDKLFKEDVEALLHLRKIMGSTYFNNMPYACNMNDSGGPITGGVLRHQDHTWVNAHTNTRGATVGIFGDSNVVGATETGVLYYMSNYYIGRSTNLINFTDDWQRLKVSNDYNPMPITKFLKFICFANMNYLAIWDAGASSFDDDRLILPDGYIIKWMKPTTDYLIIGANHPVLGGIIVLWDGISTTYNSVIQLGLTKTLGCDVQNNVCYIIDDEGWISSLAGGSTVMNKLARIPDTEDNIINLNIYADAVKFYNGKLVFGMANSSALDRDAEKRSMYCGLWEYDPITNAVYFKNTVSSGACFNYSTGYGIDYIRSVMVDRSFNQDLRVAWNNEDESFIDCTSRQSYSEGIFLITNWIDGGTATRKRFMKVILNMMKELPNTSQSKIVIKYCDTGNINKIIKIANGGSYEYFTLTILDSFYVNVGDEVQVVGGAGAGRIVNIISKELDGNNYKFTVDSSGEAFSSTSVLLISEFKVIGEPIIGNEYFESSKLLKFHCRAKKIRLKICLYTSSGSTDSQSNVGISDISAIFAEDKIIKI